MHGGKDCKKESKETAKSRGGLGFRHAEYESGVEGVSIHSQTEAIKRQGRMSKDGGDRLSIQKSF